MTIHLSSSIEERLRQLANERQCDVNALVEEALRLYIDQANQPNGSPHDAILHGQEAKGIAAASKRALSKRLADEG